VAKRVIKSPGPLYVAAAVWVLWGLFLPLYRPVHIVLAAIVSIFALILGKGAFPDKVEEIPDPPPEPETTGDPQLDALVKERDKAISEMRRLNESIDGEKISRQIDHLELVTNKIISQVISHPEKLPQIRKFMNYYLPTTMKLLNAYDRMDDAGVSGTNIDTTKGKIEEMMDRVVVAFDRQLDALFGDEALDISTDITVMDNLLKQEGFGEETPFSTGG